MISKDKQYRTRDGREVRIYATDGHPDEPVHGAFKDYNGEWVQSIWWRDGTCRFKNTVVTKAQCVDLIEVKPRIKREFWVNVYGASVYDYRIFATRNHADINAAEHATRIACVKVVIDCEEGEGL